MSLIPSSSVATGARKVSNKVKMANSAPKGLDRNVNNVRGCEWRVSFSNTIHVAKSVFDSNIFDMAQVTSDFKI